MGFARAQPILQTTRAPPRPSQHAQPVSEAQLLDQRLVKAALAHRLHQIWQPGGTAYFRGDHGTREIEAQPNAVLAGMLEHVLAILDDKRDRRVAIVAAVRTQKARGEIDAGEAA